MPVNQGKVTVDNHLVARELAPARLRSDRQILGPLRGPAGASSLATVRIFLMLG